MSLKLKREENNNETSFKWTPKIYVAYVEKLLKKRELVIHYVSIKYIFFLLCNFFDFFFLQNENI